MIGLALLLVIDFSTVSMVDRSAIIIVTLAKMGIGIVCIRMGKVSRVEVDGEQMRVVSRFGRAAEFSGREVSSVSRSMGWIVLYDREFDHNCFVFAVCDDANVRVLASELDYEMENGRHKLQDIAVSETLVSVSEMKEIISSLENFHKIL